MEEDSRVSPTLDIQTLVVASVATPTDSLRVSPVILVDFRRVALKDLTMVPKDLRAQATLFKAIRRFLSAPIILIRKHLRVLAIRATHMDPAVTLRELALQATKVQVTIKDLKDSLKDPAMDCQASRSCQTIRLVNHKDPFHWNLLMFLDRANKMTWD